MSRVKRVLRNLVKLTGLVRSNWGEMTLLQQPIGSRVMVIAPHPDDEIFGCGGAIVLHRQMGHAVDIVFLTNGEAGIIGKKPDEVSHIRRAEAIHAAQIAGVETSSLHFLKLPDGKLKNHVGKQDAFYTLLHAIKPDVIYLPSFIERHPDHVAANTMLKSNLDYPATIAAYEIWTPVLANRLLDISSVFTIKQSAMQSYTSQLNALDYADAMTSINRYRGAMYSVDVKYAEAFLILSSKEYFYNV